MKVSYQIKFGTKAEMSSPISKYLAIWVLTKKGELIRRLPEWNNVWKSQGGIMVNGVPTEVPRPKPEEPQAQRVLATVLPGGLHSP